MPTAQVCVCGMCGALVLLATYKSKEQNMWRGGTVLCSWGQDMWNSECVCVDGVIYVVL